jgi:enamine deaminase RidA (YjgF/YER057c/UK114 family)
MTPDQRFDQLNLLLPPPPKPMGVYKPCLVVDKFVYVSGHSTIRADGSIVNGKVGKEFSLDEGKEYAQLVGLSILSTLKTHLESLDKIKRVIKVLGMVNAVPEFEKHPYVINGCSELFAKVWGEDLGVGVRSAVGMNSLPGNIPVEIEAIFELN